MDSSDLACLGCSQCIVMADWGDQGISEVFRDLSTPSCAKVKLMSPSGSDGVVADVLISTESFGSSPYQRCFSYRFFLCLFKSNVASSLRNLDHGSGWLAGKTAVQPLHLQKIKVKLRHEEGPLFCFLPLPPSAVSLRVPMHVHAPLNARSPKCSSGHRVGDNEIVSKNASSRVRLLDARIPECLTRRAINLSNLEDFFRVFPVLHRNVGAGAGTFLLQTPDQTD
eukprot:symbB.v1.2.015162.t2/scaffold1126.1/size136452/3